MHSAKCVLHPRRQGATVNRWLLATAMLGVAALTAPPAAAQCEWNHITDTGPSPRRGSAMVFDSNRGVAVLWGGRDDPTFYRETWEWDGLEWALVSTGGMEATATTNAAAFDSRRNVSVFVGGNTPTGRHGETWEWDGASWRRGPDNPVRRSVSAMAYDSVRGVCVVYGGDGVGNNALSDTWEYDGSSWRQIFVSGPGPRFGHAMIYDEARGVTVLFGGYNRTQNLNDTWTWDGAQWTQVSSTGPVPRRYHVMTYDAQREVAVMFGGYDGAQPLGDTWEWDGSTWTLVTESGPVPRFWPAMAWDPAGMTVLYGGHDVARLGDTWAYECDVVGPRLEVTGECPGTVRAVVNEATPEGRVALVFAATTGSIRIPPGQPCAGTELGLGQRGAQLVGAIRADVGGTVTFQGRAPAAACSGFLQAVDLDTCGTSNVEPLP